MVGLNGFNWNQAYDNLSDLYKQFSGKNIVSLIGTTMRT